MVNRLKLSFRTEDIFDIICIDTVDFCWSRSSIVCVPIFIINIFKVIATENTYIYISLLLDSINSLRMLYNSTLCFVLGIIYHFLNKQVLVMYICRRL